MALWDWPLRSKSAAGPDVKSVGEPWRTFSARYRD